MKYIKVLIIMLCLLMFIQFILPADALQTEREQNVIVLLVEFSDAKLNHSNKEIESHMAQVDSIFREASFNKLSVKSTVVSAKYTMVKPLSYYNRPSFDNYTFLQELIDMIDNDIDFDNSWILVFHAGRSNPTGSAVYRQLIIRDQETILGFARVDSNLLPAVTVHELAHLFGKLPDLYDRSRGVGDIRNQYMSDIFYYDLDLMGAKTHGGFSAFSRIKLGWFDSTNIYEVNPWDDRTITLTPLEECKDGICVVKVPVDSSRYYLIEERVIDQRHSLILQPKFEGISITYVDESISSGLGPVRLMSINGYYTEHVKNTTFDSNILFVSSENEFMVRLVNNIDAHTIRVSPIEDLSYYEPTEVKIIVTDFLNRPQAGISMDISKDEYVVMRLRTNDLGEARFNAIQPGPYGITLNKCFRCVDPELSAIIDPTNEKKIHITINTFVFQLALILLAVLVLMGVIIGLILRKNEREAREQLVLNNIG